MAWTETTQAQYRRALDRFETDVMQEEWSVVRPHLPTASKRGRPHSTGLREVFNAIQFMLGTGCP